jgi:predicted DNA-binding protein (UPF0251 family)
MPVSFIGWSTAAESFRAIAGAKARKDASVLIVGEHGVGKRTMARLWQKAAGATEAQLPIIDLTPDTIRLPQSCIAISAFVSASARRKAGSSRPIPSDISLYHLDTGRRTAISPQECPRETLPDDLIARFKIRLYMPPLRRRMMDLLAITQFVGQKVLNRRWKGLCSALIYRMFFDSSWRGNVPDLVEFLKGLAHKSEVQRDDSKTQYLPDDGYDLYPFDSTDSEQAFLPDYGKRRGDKHQRTFWTCENVDVTFDRLPLVGLSILTSRFMLSLESKKGRVATPRYPTQATSPLGADAGWEGDEDWDAIANPTVASVEELLTAHGYGVRPKEGFPASLVKKATTFSDFGATIASIQRGMAVSVGDDDLSQYLGATPKPRIRRKARRSKPGPKPTLEPTDRQMLAYRLIVISGKTQKEAAYEMRCSIQNVQKLVEQAKEKVAALNSRSRSANAKYRFDENRDSSDSNEHDE